MVEGFLGTRALRLVEVLRAEALRWLALALPGTWDLPWRGEPE